MLRFLFSPTNIQVSNSSFLKGFSFFFLVNCRIKLSLCSRQLSESLEVYYLLIWLQVIVQRYFLLSYSFSCDDFILWQWILSDDRAWEFHLMTMSYWSWLRIWHGECFLHLIHRLVLLFISLISSCAKVGIVLLSHSSLFSAGIPYGSVNLMYGVDEHESKAKHLLTPSCLFA